MNPTRRSVLFATAGTAIALLAYGTLRHQAVAASVHYRVTHTDAEWRKLLPPESYTVLRQEGTEAPFSSPLDALYKPGIYHCEGCSLALYSSKTKFDSMTGWPSFWEPLPNAIDTRQDTSFGTIRTEVHCSQCGGHLGHVFNDGPKPTGLRYCMNGAALKFVA